MFYSKLTANSLNVLALRFGGVGLMFFLSLFLTNHYSADLVGQYDFVRSTMMILSGISILGTDQAIIYYSGILNSRKPSGQLINIYFKMSSLIFVICAILYIPIFLISEQQINKVFDKPESYGLINLAFQGLLFYSITMLNIDTIRALKHTLISELFRNIIRYTPFFFLSVIIYSIGKPEYLVKCFVYSFLLLFAISTATVFVLFLKKETPYATSEEFSIKDIFKTSYPMALSTISYFLMQSIDVLFLGSFDSFETIAHYSVSVKLATVTSLALISVNIVIAPKIAQSYNDKNFLELKSMIRKATRISLAICIPILVIVFVFSEYILLIFGDGYLLAKNAFLILLLAQLFNCICGPSALYLNMTGRQKKLNVILLISLAINVILNLILIPEFGMLGAALGTSLSFVFAKVLASATVWHLDNVKTFIY